MSDWIYNSDSSPLFVCVRLLKYQGLVCFLLSVSLYYPPQDLCVFYCLNFKRKPSAQMLKLVDMVTGGGVTDLAPSQCPGTSRWSRRSCWWSSAPPGWRSRGCCNVKLGFYWHLNKVVLGKGKYRYISFYWLKYIFNDVFVHTFLSDWSFVYLMREFNNRCLHYRKCWVRAS